ncbi:hypothetical protein FVE85_6495 [Porphyridium purpureum]|uniref:Uncharacterized protein n=1 Tax=Porphyridium purpureum TaxID=35688 RepID=A0A5J4Z6U1_PORPP|nr:hypothetical protein FVE85_6495 [Porphyridium purpureum]|eukprot:POR2325..scf295_1
MPIALGWPGGESLGVLTCARISIVFGRCGPSQHDGAWIATVPRTVPSSYSALKRFPTGCTLDVSRVLAQALVPAWEDGGHVEDRGAKFVHVAITLWRGQNLVLFKQDDRASLHGLSSWRRPFCMRAHDRFGLSRYLRACKFVYVFVRSLCRAGKGSIGPGFPSHSCGMATPIASYWPPMKLSFRAATHRDVCRSAMD